MTGAGAHQGGPDALMSTTKETAPMADTGIGSTGEGAAAQGGRARRDGAERSGRAPRGSRGFTTVLLLVYGLFALAATARSLVQIGTRFEVAPVAYLLSLVAAVTYIAVTAVLARGGRESPLALALVLVELLGVLVVGTLTIADPELFPDATVWSGFGSGYGYVPLALPVIALVYILRSRHRAAARG
ncbi:hypothetical protein ACXET9_05230 [Brachybacterium sp. DNPG3]